MANKFRVQPVNDMREVNKALSQIQDKLNGDRENIDREIRLYTSEISDKIKYTYQVSQSTGKITVPTDSEGGNQVYTLANATCTVKRNEELLPFIDGSYEADSFTVEEVSKDAGITYTLTNDSDNNLVVSITGLTVDQGYLVLDIKITEDTSDMRLVFSVEKSKALKDYYLLLTGRSISNGVGTIDVTAYYKDGNNNEILTSGNIKIVDTSDVVQGTGYVATYNSASISGTKTIRLKDLDNDVIYQVETLVDISDGADGSNAKTVRLTSDSYIIEYAEDGTTPDPSGTLTLTASNQNVGSPLYKFTGDGVSDDASYLAPSTKSLTIPSTFQTTPYVVRVGVADGDQNEVAFDTITIGFVKAGTSAYLVHGNNESHTISFAPDGTGTYDDSGIEIVAYRGATELNSVSGTPTAGQFSVSASATGITEGSENISGNSSVWGVANNMTGDPIASIIYTVNCENVASYTITQTFTRTEKLDNVGTYPVIITFDELADGVPNADGEWSFRDTVGGTYNPSDLSDVDQIHIYKNDKNSDSFKPYFEQLVSKVSSSNPIEVLLWISNTTYTKWAVTSVGEGLGRYYLSATLISKSKTSDSINGEYYTPITESAEDVQFRFSLPMAEINLSGALFGIKDADSDSLYGLSNSIPYDVNEDYSGEDLSEAYFDIVFIDEFSDTFTYAGENTTPSANEYTIRNRSTNRGTVSLSTVSSQLRVTLSSPDGVEAKGYSVTTSFDLMVSWNGQEKYVGTYTVLFYANFVPVPKAIISGDENDSAQSISNGGVGERLVFSSTDYLRHTTVGNGGRNIIVQASMTDMDVTFTYDIDMEDPDTETGDEFELYMYKNGTGGTLLDSDTGLQGFASGSLTYNGDFVDGDTIEIRLKQTNGSIRTMTFGDTNTLTLEKA